MTDYYVSDSDPAASDANAGTSSTAPWKTLTYAFSQYTGDESNNSLFLKRGDTWIESFTVDVVGTAGNVATIGAYGTGQPPRVVGTATGIGSKAIDMTDPVYVNWSEIEIDGGVSRTCWSITGTGNDCTFSSFSGHSPAWYGDDASSGVVVGIAGLTTATFTGFDVYHTNGDLFTTTGSAGLTFSNGDIHDTSYISGAVLNDGIGLHSSGNGSAAHTVSGVRFWNIYGKACVSGLVGINNVNVSRCWVHSSWCAAAFQCVNANSTWTIRNSVFDAPKAKRPAFLTTMDVCAVATGAVLTIQSCTFTHASQESGITHVSTTGTVTLTMNNVVSVCYGAEGAHVNLRAAGYTITADYNTFYPDGATGRFQSYLGDFPFSTWQAAGYDTNGQIQAPGLWDGRNAHISPWNARPLLVSTIVGDGTNLAATYTADYFGTDRAADPGAWDPGAIKAVRVAAVVQGSKTP